VPKLTLARITEPRPGDVYPDPAVPGLRYQARARGRLTGQLRFKPPGKGWQSHGLGYVDVHDRIADLIDEATERDEHGNLFLPHHPTLDEVLEPIRAKARELRRRLRTGEAPKEGGPTFATVADQFLERHVSQLAPRSQLEYRRPIDGIFKPKWGRRPLAQLTRREIATAIDEITDGRGPIAANRSLAILQSLLSWAVSRHYIDTSPAAGMENPNPERTRDRTLSDAELAALSPAFSALGYPFGDWAKLLLLTAARRDEAAKMRWADIEGLDGPEPVWRVRQKGGRLHLIPLAPTAVALLRSLPRSGEFVFSSGLTRGKESATQAPISGYSDAKERLDALAARLAAERRLERPLAAGEKPAPADSLAPWRYHDLRRTVRTNLSRLRVQPHVAELVLGHAVTGLIKVYDVHDYLAEKRAALESWEAHLARVTEGAGNVVPMPTARGAA
jgi:integrase